MSARSAWKSTPGTVDPVSVEGENCASSRNRSVPSFLYRGNGNARTARSVQALPTRGRMARPVGALERFEHLAQAFILDREASRGASPA